MQTDDDRRAFENLMLLCPNHHDLIDKDPKRFPVRTLSEIKQKHETAFAQWQPSPALNAAFGASVQDNTVTGGSIITNTGQNQGIMAHQVNIGRQPRRLSAAQTAAITTTLQQYPLGTCDVSAIYGDSDAASLVDKLKDIILFSGTNIENYSLARIPASPPSPGIVIEASSRTSAIDALLRALLNANLQASVRITFGIPRPHIFVGVNE